MSTPTERIAELLSQGKKIEAIKLLRETTGVDLKRAKEEIDRLEASFGSGEALPPSGAARPSPDLPEDVEALALQGRKIEAIKLLREQTGLGLKEAKEQVEALTGSGGKGCMPMLLLMLVSIVAAMVSMGL